MNSDIIVYTFWACLLVLGFAFLVYRSNRRNSQKDSIKVPASEMATAQSRYPEPVSDSQKVAESQSQTEAMEIYWEIHNKHNYLLWTWSTMRYLKGRLSVTYPLGWEGLDDHYSIAWIQTLSSPSTRPSGAGLSWVSTQHSVSSVLESLRWNTALVQELEHAVARYFRRKHASPMDFLTQFGDFEFSEERDLATRVVVSQLSQNSRLLNRDEILKLLNAYYDSDKQDVTVHLLAEIPDCRTHYSDDAINFTEESTICMEAVGLGLRYLIFFVDTDILPSVVIEFHLIRLAAYEFDESDFCLAAYLVRNLGLYSDIVKSYQHQESQQASTLSAEWHNLFEQVNERISVSTMTLARIDTMSGIEFEQYVGELFRQRGYVVGVTRASGDYGIDVIAEKQGVRYGVQVKRQTEKVSRNAISDAVAGKMHYRCDRAMVVTNNYFQDSAIVLGHSTKCELVDRDALQVWIEEVQKTP